MTQQVNPKAKKRTLEQDYELIMQLAQFATPTPCYQESLEQPTGVRRIRTMTTYGAYDDFVILTDA